MGYQKRTTRVRNEAKEQLKQEILLAGKELFISKGSMGFSMKDLASQFQMGATNLYNYFNSKRELFFAINTANHNNLQKNFKKIIKTHQGNQINLVVKACEVYFDLAINDPDSFRLMFSISPPPLKLRKKKGDVNGTSDEKPTPITSRTPYEDNFIPGKTNQMIDDLVKKAIKSNEIWEVDVDLLSHFLWAVIHGASIVATYYANNMEGTFDEKTAKERFRKYVISNIESLLNFRYKKI